MSEESNKLILRVLSIELTSGKAQYKCGDTMDISGTELSFYDEVGLYNVGDYLTVKVKKKEKTPETDWAMPF